MEKYDTRSVNWAHPMNNSTHLPPKSPHGGYSMFNSASLFDNTTTSSSTSATVGRGGLNLHRRSPSAGNFPAQAGHQQWLSDRLGSPDVVLKKCSHRRSSSDSVAFVDNSYQYMNYLENVTEEEVEEFAVPLEFAPPTFRPAHRRGISADHGSGDQSLQYKLPATLRSYPEKASRGDHNFTREHFPREAFQRQQQPRHENVAAAAYNRVALSKQPEAKLRSKHASGATPNAKSDSLRGGKSAANWTSNNNNNINYNNINILSFETRSTASESNSHSDDSNDDVRGLSFEGRGEDGGDGGPCSSSSDHVDPKKAKRILANRQSAQRSRVRKLQYISELEMNVNLLETEVDSLSPKVGYFDHERALLSAENVMLKQKLVALAKTQQAKEAYNETLKTDLQRLRQICNQQSQSQQHYVQRPLSPDAFELQLQRFSKLDLGSPVMPKPKSPTAFTRLGSSSSSSSSSRPSLYPTSKAVISPTRSPTGHHSPNRGSPQRVPPSCMAPSGGNKSLMMMMGGTGTSFMVHNS